MKTVKLFFAILITTFVAATATVGLNSIGADIAFADVGATILLINLLSLFSFPAIGTLMVTITTTDLATELKAFFKVNPGLPSSWVYASDVQLNKYARRITQVKGKFLAPHAVMTHVIQGFEAVWNVMGATKIKSNELIAYRQKVNFPIVPDEIEGTYLAWANEENKAHADRSISKFISEMLMEKAMDDVDDLSINGVYDSGNLNVYGNSMNGINKILTDAITATIAQTATNPVYLIPIDALTPTNMLEQVTKFEKAVPTRLRKFIKRIYMGTDKLQDYIIDVEDTLGTMVTFSEGKKVKTRINGWEIIGLDKLVGSDLIFTTPDNNLLQLIDLFDKPTITKVEDFEYTVKLYMEFWLGYGFYYNQMVFVAHTGVQSGYNDAETTSDYLPEEASGSGA